MESCKLLKKFVGVGSSVFLPIDVMEIMFWVISCKVFNGYGEMMLPLSTLIMFFAVLSWHLVVGKFCEQNKTKSENVQRLVNNGKTKSEANMQRWMSCVQNKSNVWNKLTKLTVLQTKQNLRQSYKAERLVNKTKQNLNETSLQRWPSCKQNKIWSKVDRLVNKTKSETSSQSWPSCEQNKIWNKLAKLTVL